MWIKILLLFFVFSFLFRTDHAFDQDLGRHLKLGEIITQTWSVPKVNLFSYTNPDFPFINSHWLFEVLIFLTTQTIGLWALLIIKIVIFLFAIWITLKTIPKDNMVLLLPVGFIFLHVLRERLELRPEIFSFLYTAITYFILETSLRSVSWRRSNLLFILPIIQLIWVNTHIYFFIGLALQAIYLISSRRKILIIIFVLSALVSLLNPQGLAGAFYPLNVTKNYGYTIVENQTMFLLESINFQNPNFLFVKLSVGLVVLSLLVAIARKQFEIKNALLSIAGVVLALMHVRSFPYLIFLSLPATLINFGAIPWNSLTKVIALATCILLIFESYSYFNSLNFGLKFVQSGKEALDFTLANNLPQPVFNNFDIGSYIIYRTYPNYKVFVDGRPEAYLKEFFTNLYIPMQSDYPRFKEEEKKFGFKTIIFSHTDQTPWGRNFLQNVVKDSDWKTVYLDNFMIVLVRSDLLSQLNLSGF